jgi:hypothetical protein
MTDVEIKTTINVVEPAISALKPDSISSSAAALRRSVNNESPIQSKQGQTS